jgi:hypothetical protein
MLPKVQQSSLANTLKRDNLATQVLGNSTYSISPGSTQRNYFEKLKQKL